MTFVLLGFIIFCLVTAKYYKFSSSNYNDTWLDKESTSMVNGLFVVFVFLSHFSSYVERFYTIDLIYSVFMSVMSQCVVCSFLLYSGYGMNERILSDGGGYLRNLVLRRFPSLLLKFVFCVILFLVLQFMMGNTFSVRQVLLSFVGWESLGNSNWYIFYMLFSYLAIWLSFRFARNWNISFILLLSLDLLYTIILFLCKGASAYVMTSFVLPFGMLLSKFKKQIIKLMQNRFIKIFLIALFVYIFSFGLRAASKVWYESSAKCYVLVHNILALAFSALLFVLTFKIKLKNEFLRFCGNHVFELYILQRLPMIALKPVYLTALEKYGVWAYLPYLIASVLITVMLAVMIQSLFKKIGI